jgi:hypothetical protein
MRRRVSFPVLVAISALTGVGSVSPAAATIQDRYCLQGRIWGYPGNCQFSNYAQCMATASGTDAYCGSIPNTCSRASGEAPIGTDNENQGKHRIL